MAYHECHSATSYHGSTPSTENPGNLSDWKCASQLESRSTNRSLVDSTPLQRCCTALDNHHIKFRSWYFGETMHRSVFSWSLGSKYLGNAHKYRKLQSMLDCVSLRGSFVEYNHSLTEHVLLEVARWRQEETQSKHVLKVKITSHFYNTSQVNSTN